MKQIYLIAIIISIATAKVTVDNEECLNVTVRNANNTKTHQLFILNEDDYAIGDTIMVKDSLFN